MNWRLSFVVFFASFLFFALILLFGSMHLFNLFLRRVTAPTPPTITLLLSLWLLLRFSKLCLTPTSSNISNLTIFFQDSEIPPLNSVNILGFQISSSLSWRDHIVQIAKSASKKLGVLFCCKQYFNAAQLFKLYTGFICPCLEYCSHIWSSSPYTSFLDRIESKAIRLIGDPPLTSTLDPLSLRRKVVSLSLFYR